MNHFTAMATSPVYEFPYSGGYPMNPLPNYGNDIDALLASIASSGGASVYNPAPTVTLTCVPQINTLPNISNNTLVYQVPEDVPLETILQQLGVSPNTLQASHSVNNYYRSASQPIDLYLPPSSPRRRRLVCQEVSDSDDDYYLRRPSHRHHRDSRDYEQRQAPVAIHDVLSRVWSNAKRGPDSIRPSASAPNLSSQWQAMRNSPPPPPATPPPRSPPPVTPPPNPSAVNAWKAMLNASPPMSQYQQNAVSNVWNRADNATEQKSGRLASIFNRMRQPTGSIFQSSPPPSPPPQNREAVQNFFAARNVPYGVNTGMQPFPQQNREAAQNFLAARNIPYGVNTGMQTFPQQNREAAQNFLAARNIPYGVNTGMQAFPQQNREAVQDFFAARNIPYGVNTGMQSFPQQNREAAQNFLAARNIPYGVNLPNPSATNQPPPMINPSWNQMPPPSMNTTWNRMPQNPPRPMYPSYINTPFGGTMRAPTAAPAPASFASLLSQAHRQRLPYAGAA